MRPIEVVALAAVAAWLGLLTLAVMLSIRQIGLLMVRMDADPAKAAPGVDGLEIGQALPAQVQAGLPQDQVTYVVAMEGGCVACRRLAAQIADTSLEAKLVAVVKGGGRDAEALADLLSPRIAQVVREPAASRYFGLLKIAVTPAVFEVDRGYVTGRALAHDISELISLIEAREFSDADEVPDRARELGALKLEVYGASN